MTGRKGKQGIGVAAGERAVGHGELIDKPVAFQSFGTYPHQDGPQQVGMENENNDQQQQDEQGDYKRLPQEVAGLALQEKGESGQAEQIDHDHGKQLVDDDQAS